MKQISVLVTISSNKIEAEATGLLYGVELNSENFYKTSFRGTVVEELEIPNIITVRKDDGTIVYCKKEQISGKILVDVPTSVSVQRTGNEISFDDNTTYGSIATPIEGNLTLNLSNFKLGATTVIIHQDSTEPSYPNQFKKINSSSEYLANEINFITAEILDQDNIIFSISQFA